MLLLVLVLLLVLGLEALVCACGLGMVLKREGFPAAECGRGGRVGEVASDADVAGGLDVVEEEGLGVEAVRGDVGDCAGGAGGGVGSCGGMRLCRTRLARFRFRRQ